MNAGAKTFDILCVNSISVVNAAGMEIKATLENCRKTHETVWCCEEFLKSETDIIYSDEFGNNKGNTHVYNTYIYTHKLLALIVKFLHK